MLAGSKLRLPLLAPTLVSLLLLLLTAVPTAAGVLGFVESVTDGVGGVDGIDQPRWATLSPDGAHLYAASELDNAVAVFARNPTTGALTFVEQQRDGVGGVDGLAMAHGVAVSPDGAHVYAVGIADDAVAVFSRNPITGALTFVEQQKDGVGGVDGLWAVTSVTVSPDGAHVYTSSYFDNAVAVFSRNPVTGALTFVEQQKDGVGGVDGLAGGIEVTLSPDGLYVYTAAQLDNAVAVFARNPMTGALTFVERKKDGLGGVDGIASTTSVTVSPDGAHVYATSYYLDEGVAVFSRNPVTGVLTFVQATKDGEVGVDGLSQATAAKVSPDGAFVYVTGFNDNAIVAFRRDVGTGALTFSGVIKDGRMGVDGLSGASSVVVSPDGIHVYVTAENDDAIAVFRVICDGIAPGDPCDDGDPCTADDRCISGACVDAAVPVPCRTPTVGNKALVQLTDKSPDQKDALTWSWTKGAATTKAEFGDPVGSDDFVLCVYDEAALALKAGAPFGDVCADDKPCWTEKPKSFQYADKDLSPDGLSKVQLQQGLDGKAKILVKGRGALLGMPSILGLSSPVTVRLKNVATQACWEATYTFGTSENLDPARFKQKAD